MEHLLEVSSAEYITTEQDIAALRTTQLADYHMAVTAMQLDNREVFLSEVARTEAVDLIDRTHHDLLLAAGDAMTKELLPGRFGFTTGGQDVSGQPAVIATAGDETLREKYLPYTRPEAVTNRRSTEIGTEMTELLYGMRQALYTHRGDKEMTRDIVTDIARATRVVFNEQRQNEEAEGLAPERGWLEFTSYVEHMVDAEQTGSRADRYVATTIVINAVHDGSSYDTHRSSILERMTVDREYGRRLVQVLDATRGNYDELLPHTGYLGGMLYMYLTGKRKSLGGLAAKQAVPPAFTQLLG
jgi:hypothetical protein